MNTCTTCCNPKTPDCDSVEMSNLQRCNGVTMHGCGNPMYNVYAWDCHHGHCGGPCGPQGCIGHKPEPCAIEMLCSYLTKAEAAKIYVNHKEFLAFNTAIAETYATKDELSVNVQELQEAIEAETVSRTAADNALEGRIDAYRDELDEKINNEIGRATAAEQTLTNNLNSEISRATQAEQTIQNSLNAEVSRAQAAESALNDSITAESNRAQSAEATLNTAIATTSSRLDNEITRATNAETSINTSLNNYIATNNAALTNEVNRATAAENNISTAVSTLNNRVNADLVHSADYDSANKQILFKNADGTVIDSIDATAFIKDGMVSNVQVINGVLKITFNTDAGKSDIDIPISSIFDANNYYTKAEINSTLNSYYTKTQIDNTLNSYYTKSQVDNTFSGYYTKAEVDALIAQAINNAIANYYTKSQADAKFVAA